MAICSICQDERAREINVALLNGHTVKATALKYGIRLWVLKEHRRKHLPWKDPRLGPAVTVLEKMEELSRELKRLQVLAECGIDTTKALMVVRQRQSLLELEARMEHLLGATHSKLMPKGKPAGDYKVRFVNGRPETVEA